jgi:protease IV
MKKLLVIFLVLVVIAVVAAVGGVVLAGRNGLGREEGGRLGGPTVLVWRVDGPLIEQAVEPSFPFGGPDVDSMAKLYAAFRAAREDKNVEGLAVYIQDAHFGLAKAQELRRQFGALRRAGKFVECYLEAAGEGGNGTLAYFLASACDKIHLAPAADVNLLGLYAEGVFFKGTLDKLKIEPDFDHVGRYKSAAETFTEKQFSPSAAEALNEVLDESFGQIVAGIAEGRRLPAAAVRRLIDGGPYSAPEALAGGLIDGLAYPDEFRKRVEKRAGGKPQLVAIEDYEPGSGLAAKRVAVVFALGVIARGEGGTPPFGGEVVLGSDGIAKVLRDLADDGSVSAVVLRIDSPGGSALASDLILREVELLQRKKPVVVSMSDVAASGGYYIAAKARKIVAEPATLTGSIGVVGGKFVTRGLEEEVLGITREPLKRGANADFYTSYAPYSPEQQARVHRLMERVYSLFVGHVAAGRRMSRQGVEAIAEGRVWTGQRARQLGLVDELGGLDRAIELAREAAGIARGERLRLDYYPERPSWIELLGRKRREPLLKAELPADIERLARLLNPRPQGLLELPPEAAALTRAASGGASPWPAW